SRSSDNQASSTSSADAILDTSESCDAFRRVSISFNFRRNSAEVERTESAESAPSANNAAKPSRRDCTTARSFRNWSTSMSSSGANSWAASSRDTRATMTALTNSSTGSARLDKCRFLHLYTGPYWLPVHSMDCSPHFPHTAIPDSNHLGVLPTGCLRDGSLKRATAARH